MAWESRRGRGRYYTRSTRVNGRVVRQYVGSGPLAEKAAEEDARRRAERQARAEALRAERERLAQAQALLQGLCSGTDLLLRAALTAAGFHQHNRGAWRLKNVPRDET